MFQTRLFVFGSSFLIFLTFNQCSGLDSVSGSASKLVTSASDSTSALMKSLSTSVSSISDSISDGKEDKKEAYREDIKSTLVLFYEHPKTQKDLEQDLTLIAKEHGITNWKNNANTYFAIGQGLKLAGAEEYEFKSMVTRVAQNNDKMATLLKEGYKSVR